MSVFIAQQRNKYGNLTKTQNHTFYNFVFAMQMPFQSFLINLQGPWIKSRQVRRVNEIIVLDKVGAIFRIFVPLYAKTSCTLETDS